MKDLDAILRARAQARGPLVLATVVEVSGSAYRRPGARMLMSEDGWLAGGISGGCLEADIVRKAFFWTTTGPRLLRYDSTSNTAEDEGAFSFALGCNGVVDVLLERWEAGAGEALSFAAEAREAGRRAVVATVYRGPANAVGSRLKLRDDGTEAGQLSGALGDAVREAAREALEAGRTWSGPCGGADVLVEVVEPPHPLVLFGSGFDVAPVVNQAAALGWHVTVVADRPAQALRRRFPQAHAVVSAKAPDAPSAVPLSPRALAVLMTHSLPQDRELLARLLPRPLRYLGVLGPRSRTDRLLAELPSPPTDAHLEKLHAPVGLDLGAEGAEEIALSIIAELQAVVAGREGGKLRERRAPIHTAAPLPAQRLA
ncbi:XdhC/CoxI family protein [Myxococcus xanthus DK 1622]|uniref:XdhC/CoxI family protein n=1 Tax=Myxococcus xanthus (strain DK1622) TaxID=246197 RepID=Q1CZC9_MYXXD|nr:MULTISPECIES: XdhC/CoxI family protein [Myxococcus]ABF87357.1 XdhC/CoxI family protein [Myxococcus xanthus DK 1622]NOJ57465.1 XdhC family protein [Myxococcus xanthus]QPM78506.1 XdhC family protein [Myxococcus xanthus]QVW67574.1 XdhC family protein [Myxococcus xanthus DZ2]QZZ53746.1 putative xanthine dehydrogenase subunit A [Myxococcus xanthus]